MKVAGVGRRADRWVRWGGGTPRTGERSARVGAGSPRMDGLVGQDEGGFAHEDGRLVKTGAGSPRTGAGSPRMDGLVGQDSTYYNVKYINIVRKSRGCSSRISTPTYVRAEVGGDGPGEDIDVEGEKKGALVVVHKQ